eukprot:TRINITY_DN5691_c0_g1_i1.p1 TRINITY_DN5691_c0_g1~~TRINITY_DN5691_c0_g1_i1.p1  ORF type:complete len:457 (-),score=86.44 TRINITY_DN5691_c0_g1_i1:82-1452(-)
MDQLSPGQLERLGADATQFALGHGILLCGQPAPHTLFPSAMPRALFEKAISLTPIINRALAAAAKDFSFIEEALAPCKHDDLVGPLLQLAQETARHGQAAPASLLISRNDYMMDTVSSDLRQIEINTIACAFPGLAPRVEQLHRFVLKRAKLDHLLNQIPENKSNVEIPAALAAAHKLYAKDDAVIAFVIQPGERNTMDQWWLEYALFENHGIRCIRVSLLDIHTRGKIQPDQSLQLDGYEISVAYFRAGYTPKDYPTQDEWDGRGMIEHSRCISCPDAAGHLLTAKKFQQVIALPGKLEQLLDASSAHTLRSTFAGLWAGDDEHAGAQALANPSKFVLKPQREGGGGSNLYGDAVATALRSFPPEEKAMHILMSLVSPPETPNYLVRNAVVTAGATVMELGAYGVLLTDGRGGGIVENRHAGHLVRSKFSDALDGGVAAGIAMLDSPRLVDDIWW